MSADDSDPLDTDSLTSLPSSATSSSSSTAGDFEDSADDAEQEWRESLQQLELLLTMVIVPYLGRYFGRKCAFWGVLLFSFCYIRKEEETGALEDRGEALGCWIGDIRRGYVNGG